MKIKNLDWDAIKVIILFGLIFIILGVMVFSIDRHIRHKIKSLSERHKETFMAACMKVEQNQDICDYEYLKVKGE